MGSEGRDGNPLFGTKWRQCQPVIYIVLGLATSNQSALFMMSINRYYVKCVLYSADSTASQQRASLQLQDIEDTSNDYIYGWCYILQL